MTWTYDPDVTEDRDKIRFFLQDTDDNDQLITDEEIAFTLTEYGDNIYRAAAVISRSIALQLGRRPSVRLAQAGLDADEQYQHYMAIAKEMESKALSRGATGVFAGGISKADKETREADTDRVAPAFTADLHHDNGT